MNILIVPLIAAPLVVVMMAAAAKILDRARQRAASRLDRSDQENKSLVEPLIQ